MGDTAEGQVIGVSQAMPDPLRWVLGGVGLGVAILATWELRRGLYPVSVVTPFFGAMVLGAWTVGGGLAAVATLAPEERWLISRGRIRIRRRWGRHVLTDDVGPEDVEDITVNEQSGDSTTWRLRVDLNRSLHAFPATFGPVRMLASLAPGLGLAPPPSATRWLLSPDFGTRVAAEAARDLFRS